MNRHLQAYIAEIGTDRVFCPAHHLDDAGAPIENPELPDSTVAFSDYEGWTELRPDGNVHRHLAARGRRLP